MQLSYDYMVLVLLEGDHSEEKILSHWIMQLGIQFLVPKEKFGSPSRVKMLEGELLIFPGYSNIQVHPQYLPCNN
jgi:hypothetical protein